MYAKPLRVRLEDVFHIRVHLPNLILDYLEFETINNMSRRENQFSRVKVSIFDLRVPECTSNGFFTIINLLTYHVLHT
jgi:hypothetical protein